MKKIHALSGLIISIFITLHLLNHLTGIWGVESHLALMERLRVVYRHPIVETFLLTAVAVQIITGLRMFSLKRLSVKGFYNQLQIWSGLYLVIFFLIHVGAILIGRHVLQLDTNFYFGAAGINTFPFNLFFVPYYALAILSFFGHLAALHHRKVRQTIFGLTVKQRSGFILIQAVVVTFAIFYGLTDGFAGVEIPLPYHIMVGK